MGSGGFHRRVHARAWVVIVREPEDLEGVQLLASAGKEPAFRGANCEAESGRVLLIYRLPACLLQFVCSSLFAPVCLLRFILVCDGLFQGHPDR